MLWFKKLPMGNMSIVYRMNFYYISTTWTCLIIVLSSLSTSCQTIEILTFGASNNSFEENSVNIGLADGASLGVDISLQESEIDIETTLNNIYVAQLSENNAQCLLDTLGNAIHFNSDLYLSSDFRSLIEENLFFQVIINSTELDRIMIRDPTTEYLGTTVEYIGVVRECDGAKDSISFLNIDENPMAGFEFDTVEFGINPISKVVSLIIKFRGNIISSQENTISSIDNIIVFPNPTNQNFRIQNCEEVERLEIYNLEGNLVDRQSMNMLCEFETNGLQGLYVLRFFTKSGKIKYQKIQFL